MSEAVDRLARVREQLAAIAKARPTPEELALHKAADVELARRLQAARPGVPLHHVLATLEALRAVRALDEAVPAPADGSLRDRIAQALADEDARHWGYDHDFVSQYGDDAETDGFVNAVLAVLPPAVDQAAVLRERADFFEGVLHNAADPSNDPRYWTAVSDIVMGLRRLADEAQPAQDLAAADNPTPLRWGLNDVMWGDDDTVTVLLSGPNREPYWLELDPERAAVLRQDLAGPDGAQGVRQ